MNVKEEFEKIIAPVQDEVNKFPWDDPAAYSLWLAQTYYFVLHSTRLFACASSRCSLQDNKLHFHLLEHLSQEKGHENLAVHDLKALGLTIDELPELPETASMYQIQYFWIEHFGPTSFFGYLLCLEGLAVTVGKAAYEKAATAHEKRACSFLKVHIEEDENHLAEVFNHVSEFSPEQQELALRNLNQSANLYKNMLKHIGELARGSEKTVAA